MNAFPRLVRTASTAAAAMAATLGLSVPAAAAAPEIVEVDVTFPHAVLSEACGLPVQMHLRGTFQVLEQEHRTFSNFRFRGTFTSEHAAVESRAYGPTVEERHDDGSVTVTQLGVTMRNVPGSGTVGPNAGRIVTVVDVDGAELRVFEAGFEQGPQELCAVLRGEKTPPGGR